MTTTNTRVLTALKEIHDVHKLAIDTDNVDLAQTAIDYTYRIIDSILIDENNCQVSKDLTGIIREFRQRVDELTVEN